MINITLILSTTYSVFIITWHYAGKQSLIRHIMTTFQALYESRCQNGKPYRWTPQPLEHKKLPIESDGIPETLQRVLASALYLEIDVAQYLAEGWKSDIKGKNSVPEYAEKLIESNIPDESVHLAQFEYAAQTYPVSQQFMDEAKQISQMWADNDSHPLLKATILELGVFVPCSLPLLLRVGGLSLGWVGQMVSQDEQRHQATGRAVCSLLKLNPYKVSASLDNLREITIRWIMGEGYLKRWDYGVNWFIKQSDIVSSGNNAPELSKWTNVPRYAPPFESENRFQGY